MKLPEYAKTVVAAVAAGAVALSAALSDSVVTGSEGVTIGLAVLGALGVYAIPNRAKRDRP
ncbi:MAG: hypothetical protein ACRDP6_14605 [Actinoallomurus sp.]